MSQEILSHIYFIGQDKKGNYGKIAFEAQYNKVQNLDY